MPGIASLGPQLRQIRVQSTENNPFYGTGTNNAGAPAPPSYRYFPSLDVGGVSTVAYGPARGRCEPKLVERPRPA
jgi:hypothetical protein